MTKHVPGVLPEMDAPPGDPGVPASSREQEGFALRREERKVSKRRNQREESPGRPTSQINSFYSDRRPLIYVRAERQACASKSVVWGPSRTFPQPLCSGSRGRPEPALPPTACSGGTLSSDVPGPLDGVASTASVRTCVPVLRTGPGSRPLSWQGRGGEGFQELGRGSEARWVATALGESRKPLEFWQDP